MVLEFLAYRYSNNFNSYEEAVNDLKTNHNNIIRGSLEYNTLPKNDIAYSFLLNLFQNKDSNSWLAILKNKISWYKKFANQYFIDYKTT